MLIYDLRNWAEVRKAQFLTKKTGTIYAYAYGDKLLIGTATEIYENLSDDVKSVDRSDCIPMEQFYVPIDRGFLVKLEIKSVS